jgi:hypothetical protein
MCRASRTQPKREARTAKPQEGGLGCKKRTLLSLARTWPPLVAVIAAAVLAAAVTVQSGTAAKQAAVAALAKSTAATPAAAKAPLPATATAG